MWKNARIPRARDGKSKREKGDFDGRWQMVDATQPGHLLNYSDGWIDWMTPRSSRVCSSLVVRIMDDDGLQDTSVR